MGADRSLIDLPSPLGYYPGAMTMDERVAKFLRDHRGPRVCSRCGGQRLVTHCVA